MKGLSKKADVDFAIAFRLIGTAILAFYNEKGVNATFASKQDGLSENASEVTNNA